MANWIDGTVTDIKWWNQKLFSLTLSAPLPSYKAGQFTKLAMTIEDKKIARAYSFVNTPSQSDLHEFLLVTVQDGLLSPPLSELSIGETVHVAEQASGFFTLDEVPSSKYLWLLSTGTAIGPFLSMLGDPELWQKFEKVILVHGVRKKEDLVYQELIVNTCQSHPLTFVPMVSQETITDGLSGRITNALTSKTLFNYVGVEASPENSQFMLCGNPEMVKETTEILLDLGFTRNRRAKPGNITVEQYW